jgi:hypothetical protein
MKLPDTSVSVVDVEGGVALDFSSTSDAAELRRRVAHMASMHNQGMHGSMTDGGMHGGRMGGTMHGGMVDGGMRGHMMDGGMHGHRMDGGMHGAMHMPESDVRVEDTERGARMVLKPKDPADLETLRAHARHMVTGGCPMASR